MEPCVTLQTSSFPPAHKSRVGIKTFCHLLSATNSGGRSAFLERLGAGLDIGTEKAVLDIGAGICVIQYGALTNWQVFVIELDMAGPEDGDEVEALGMFSLTGAVLTFLVGRASTLIHDYESG